MFSPQVPKGAAAWRSIFCSPRPAALQACLRAAYFKSVQRRLCVPSLSSLGTLVHLGHPQRPEGGSLFLLATFEVGVVLLVQGIGPLLVARATSLVLVTRQQTWAPVSQFPVVSNVWRPLKSWGETVLEIQRVVMSEAKELCHIAKSCGKPVPAV